MTIEMKTIFSLKKQLGSRRYNRSAIQNRELIRCTVFKRGLKTPNSRNDAVLGEKVQ